MIVRLQLNLQPDFFILKNYCIGEFRLKTRTSTLAEKIIMIVGVIFCAILIPLLIINITIIVKGTLNPKTPPSIFGVTPLVVMSGSMDDGSKDCISTGDLIFSRNIDSDNFKNEILYLLWMANRP